MQRKILNRCKSIVEEALREDINLTIEELYEDKFDEQELPTIIKEIANGELRTIQNSLSPIPLPVSYDME